MELVFIFYITFKPVWFIFSLLFLINFFILQIGEFKKNGVNKRLRQRALVCGSYLIELKIEQVVEVKFSAVMIDGKICSKSQISHVHVKISKSFFVKKQITF